MQTQSADFIVDDGNNNNDEEAKEKDTHTHTQIKKSFLNFHFLRFSFYLKFKFIIGIVVLMGLWVQVSIRCNG
jgi:hypothetical protein